MNTSGEAADQIVKIFMDGAERLVRLSGSGVKHGTVLVYSLAKEQHKTKGKARLSSMLRSGKPLKVYTFNDKDLPQFKKVASQYGILYSILKEKDNTGGVFDVMVRAEDENKIARIIERFNLAQVDVTNLRAEVVEETEQNQEAVKDEAIKTEESQSPPETEHPTKSEAQRVADDIFSEPQQGDKATKQNPLIARTETTRSEKQMEQSSSSKSPTSVLSERESNTIINGGRKENERDREGERKPSVKKRIEEIKKEREKSAKRTPEKNKGKSRSKNKNKKSRDRSSR